MPGRLKSTVLTLIKLEPTTPAHFPINTSQEKERLMRIALLSPVAWRTPPRHYGPWEQIAYNITEGLVSRGFDVTLFATGDSITSATLSSVCAQGYEEDRNADPKVIECLHISHLYEHAHDFDLIHNNYDFMPLTYTGRINTPMLTTIHGFSSPKIIPVYKKYNKTNYYASISKSDRSPELDYIANVYNGINMDKFEFADNTGDYLLFFSRIHPDKGTVEAIQIAQKYGMKLIMAGIIQDRDYFEKEVKPLIDNKTVVFVGHAEPEKRSTLMGEAYAMLHPINFEEPFGLTVVESMACGTPVVAFNRGSMPELIKHGENGFLVKSVEEAVDVLGSVGKLDRSGCRRWVEEQFSKEKMVDDYVKVYEQMLEGSPKHAFPPWGHWEVLTAEPSYKVKRITVDPGKRLSYQKHSKRDETWTAVSGRGVITLDEHDKEVLAGDVIHIPREIAHRITNTAQEPFVFIEVQQGDYLGEDDIVRLEDDFGRA